MFNDTDTAIVNQQTQQGYADGVLNYNQQHGILGDLIEDAQDHITSNLGLGSLGTGGSRQTGDVIEQMTTINNGNVVISAHSQGTMMTQNGLDQRQKNISNLVQDHTDVNFLVQYSGAPVNHEIAEEKITEIYGGEEGIRAHMGNDAKIDNVFRSQVAPEDFVGSVLGYQSAGINNSENLGVNMRESTLSVGRLFGLGGSSTHSYYGCIIGCGEENFTPDKYQYYTPNQLDNEGKPQAPISNYYHENFEVTKVKKDKDGKEIKVKEMTINMELLQNNNKPKNNIPSIDMSALKGDD